ncbi:MAG: hypothetical protein KF768_04230 [Phycisphaeraceae bacterium]|nr:hypothetical protein [Phycisphaeraceae bacterium]
MLATPSRCANALRALSIAYLAVQSLSLVAFWVWLAIDPDSRRLFVAANGPDATLLPFGVADILVYGSASSLSAWGLWRTPRANWVFAALCVHAGAAMYAASYAIGVLFWDPTRWLGASMMLPALFVPPFIAWLHRPASFGAAQ